MINPAFFTDADLFKKHISQVMAELKSIKPAVGFEQVLYPGEIVSLQRSEAKRGDRNR